MAMWLQVLGAVVWLQVLGVGAGSEDEGCGGRVEAVGRLCPWIWGPAGWWPCLTACEKRPVFCFHPPFERLVSVSLLGKGLKRPVFPLAFP